MGNHRTGSHHRPTSPYRTAATVWAMAMAVWGGGCLKTGPQFSVGDCVRVEEGILDSDISTASCSEAVGTFDPDERIYRVDSIVDNTDGGCPQGAGFFPVEFIHQPDGVTYCLVMET